jgi:hypothetical protein
VQPLGVEWPHKKHNHHQNSEALRLHAGIWLGFAPDDHISHWKGYDICMLMQERDVAIASCRTHRYGLGVRSDGTLTKDAKAKRSYRRHHEAYGGAFRD